MKSLSLVAFVMFFLILELVKGEETADEFGGANDITKADEKKLQGEINEEGNEKEHDIGKRETTLSVADEISKRSGGGGSFEEKEEEEVRKKKDKNKDKDKKPKTPKTKEEKILEKKEKQERENQLWFKPIGCFKDTRPKPWNAWKQPELRAVSTLYQNVRRKINWRIAPNYNDTIKRCAEGAQKKGYACFGVQFYGECWGALDACETYARYGPSKKCINGVGLHWTNFMYQARCGSVYGCCPDGAMPAAGPNDEGCPDCVTAVDIVFVVDSSGSIGRANFRIVKAILMKLIGHFSVSDSYARIGIVQYSSKPKMIFTLKNSQTGGFKKLERAVKKKMVYRKGSTRTGMALNMTNEMFKVSKERLLRRKVLKHEQVVIVLTDGLTNDDDKERLTLLSTTLKGKSKVIAVGVFGRNYSNEMKIKQRAELVSIASSINDIFYQASFKKLRNHVDPIAKQACPLKPKRG